MPFWQFSHFLPIMLHQLPIMLYYAKDHYRCKHEQSKKSIGKGKNTHSWKHSDCWLATVVHGDKTLLVDFALLRTTWWWVYIDFPFSCQIRLLRYLQFIQQWYYWPTVTTSTATVTGLNIYRHIAWGRCRYRLTAVHKLFRECLEHAHFRHARKVRLLCSMLLCYILCWYNRHRPIYGMI